VIENRVTKEALACLAALFLSGCAGSSINIHRLSERHFLMRRQVLDRLDPLIEQRRQRGDLATLSFEDLYRPLNSSQKRFVQSFLAINPQTLQIATPACDSAVRPSDLVVLGDQIIRPDNGDPWTIKPQFLPRPVYEAFMKMADQMKQDIGRTIYAESGYRSPAYQFYLFLYYMDNHDYSILETLRFVAWPGHSEHGCPPRQAVDIITENGINSEHNPAQLEATEEFQWMLKNAGQFGFELSYPKDSKTAAYEPWHWRYTKGG
jgi:LAS superfamily LD-carboxypeptidase LdcB